MATVVLQYAGAALGTLVGGPLGGVIGRAVGAVAGNVLDQRLFGSKTREGPRLNGLRVMASEEGAAIPVLWGRMRIGAQMIWASNLMEETDTSTASISAKGPLRPTSTSYAYFANMALGLCEGEIDGIGRAWADGRPIDLAAFSPRIHTGTETQQPDSLIEAIEGPGNAPAYRGLAYIVFERLPLESFGNRIPQFTFEVFRRGNDVATGVTAVNIIPGSTEFGYDTTLVQRVLGPGQTTSENAHVSTMDTDWTVSLDQLHMSAPNLDMVSLVVAWFGDDLRCGNATLRPGVDDNTKQTTGRTWQVNGVSRANAHEVSRVNASPAFGGTPSDLSVLAAIADVKARALKVTFYPFILMDIPAGNTLPDPYGAPAQPNYPWRGRMTCAIAPGHPGSPDKTAAVASQVAAFVGTAQPQHFSSDAMGVTYSGPAEWSYRRMILHYAKLCAAAGGVDAFLIGSELRGLTTLRSGAGTFPFVAALQSLAQEVKAILPSAKVSYAADWSEYFGHQPADGTGDVYFHLDPLWASPSIDFIGIDNYLPLSDWRDGTSHADYVAGYNSIHDPAYLTANIAGGEGHDWYYASEAARIAQQRTPITDGAFNKPWVFRNKDVKSWWLNAHVNRPGGVEAPTPTPWVPQSKPIWFTEFGCPAIDKGSNAPNLFFDAKSSESAVPPFSTAQRDDVIQLRAIAAMQNHWSTTGTQNPVSSVYGAPMVAAGKLALWAWDARPHPAFPGLVDVWSDGPNYDRGHWLNGRLMAVDLAVLIRAICQRSGLDAVDVGAVTGLVDGFLLDRPMSARDALHDLLEAFAIDAVERDGTLQFRMRAEGRSTVLPEDAVVDEGDDKPRITRTRAQETDLPQTVRLGFVDAATDYQSAAVMKQRTGTPSRRDIAIALPAAVNSAVAQARVDALLDEAWATRTSAQFSLPPSWLACEPGDVLTIEGAPFRVTGITDGLSRKIEAMSHAASAYQAIAAVPRPPVVRAVDVPGPPDVVMMDLALTTAASGPRPWIAAQAKPWLQKLVVVKQAASGAFAFNSFIDRQATMGLTLGDLPAGLLARVDYTHSLDVKLDHGAFAAQSMDALLAGGNLVAIGDAATGFELLQFQSAALLSANTYRLSGLLRGLAGSVADMLPLRPAGARIVLLNSAVVQAEMTLDEAARASAWRIGPRQFDHGHGSYVPLTLGPVLKALRPLPPVRLDVRRDATEMTFTWMRQTRLGGDSWDLAEVPLSEDAEAYRVDLLDGPLVRHSATVQAPQYAYSLAALAADFAGTPPQFTLRVAQLSTSFGAGTSVERIIHV